MNFKEILLLSFDALKERKVRSILTILMVVVGSSLMVALNGLGAGFGKFIDESFSSQPLVPSEVAVHLLFPKLH